MAGRLMKEATIYQNEKARVSVFTGTNAAGKRVVIKEQNYRSLEEANFSIAEAMNQVRLNHKHIVVIHDAKVVQENGFTVRIVMEYMPGGDLFKEIQRRKAAGQRWQEDEVLMHLRDLADALAFAQESGIAHRDLKPQNIFIGEGGRLKIGDFGSSSNAAEKASTTVLGSPYYLSPELKSQYMKMMGVTSAYDPFKSDVFSLAVAVLMMETLEIDQNIGNASNPYTAVNAAIGTLSHHPRVQNCLCLMTKERPEERISFADLRTYIDNLTSQSGGVCSVCGASVPQQWAQHCQQKGTAWVCSENCLQNEMGHNCIVCQQKYTQFLQLSDDDSLRYRGLRQSFQSVCSLQCLGSLFQLFASKCLKCQCELANCEHWLVRLDCQHCFHSAFCMRDYISQCRQGEYTCPLCGTPISPAVLDAMWAHCILCGIRQQLFGFPCGHYMCESCGNSYAWECNTCKQSILA